MQEERHADKFIDLPSGRVMAGEYIACKDMYSGHDTLELVKAVKQVHFSNPNSSGYCWMEASTKYVFRKDGTIDPYEHQSFEGVHTYQFDTSKIGWIRRVLPEEMKHLRAGLVIDEL